MDLLSLSVPICLKVKTHWQEYKQMGSGGMKGTGASPNLLHASDFTV